MTTPLSEQDSRHVPWQPDEYAWAHDRPSRHRVRMPDVGDTVYYRHDDWTEPVEATVVWVQPIDDVDDPNLATPTQDQLTGDLVLHEGRPVMALKVDPWRRLHLKTPFGVFDTREARLRGSPGWLPLDWRNRHRPVPQPQSPPAPPIPAGVSGGAVLLEPSPGGDQ
jgi:hypothetical protein